jgi:hypothetical protein
MTTEGVALDLSRFFDLVRGEDMGCPLQGVKCLL